MSKFKLSLVQNKFEIIFLFIISISALMILTFGWENFFKIFYIDTMTPIFADSRVWIGANKSRLLGYDPYINNPYDPWERELGYPRIWMFVAQFFQLEGDHILLLFMLISISLFFWAALHISKKSKKLLSMILIFSWPTLLLLERGNNDIYIFIFLYLFVTAKKEITRVFSLLITIFLKLYTLPLLVFIKNRKIQIFSVFLTALYLIVTFDDLKKIIDSPQNTSYREIQYGMKVSYQFLFSNLNLIYLVLLILFSAIFVLFVHNKFVKNELSNVVDNTDKQITFFIYGSVIFLFSYLFLVNYDTRLVFLIFCIPFISKLQSILNFLGYFLILLSMNFGLIYNFFSIELVFNSDKTLYLVQIFQFIKFLTFLYFLIIFINLMIQKNILTITTNLYDYKIFKQNKQ